jgi:hypothetical protein
MKAMRDCQGGRSARGAPPAITLYRRTHDFRDRDHLLTGARAMTDEDFEKIRVIMNEVIAPVLDRVGTVENKIDVLGQVQAEQSNAIELLRQDVTKIRNVQMGQEVKLDDVQDYFSRIAEGMDRLRPPAVPPLGEGRITEIRQMHSQINAGERKMAELQARIEVLEGSRIR